jgi:hypothetical protein
MKRTSSSGAKFQIVFDPVLLRSITVWFGLSVGALQRVAGLEGMADT